MMETKLGKDTQISRSADEKAVGVLLIHGMGTQKNTYTNKMIAELNYRLGNNHDHIARQAVFGPTS